MLNTSIKKLILSTTILSNLLALVSAQAFAEQRKDFSASIAPNNHHITYYSYRGEKLPDIYIANADGSDEKNITATDDIWEIEPSWSNDGENIIFSGGLSMADMELYIMNPDGTKRRQLTDGPGNAIAAQWHPKERLILYKRWQSDELVTLHIVNPDTGVDNRLGESPSKYSGASWSPDGTKLAAVVAGTKDGHHAIAITDSHFKQLNTIELKSYKAVVPTWTPDSKGLVFASGVDNKTNELFAYHLEQEEIRQISKTNDDTVYFAEFSRNGHYIYMDRGSWESNFLLYRAAWDNNAWWHKTLELEQISGTGAKQLSKAAY